jgi:5'-methylthioadenosine phosphorylase
MTQNKIKVGIIGGSGMDDPQLFSEIKTREINTPYGKPSDRLIVGKIGAREVIVLARHVKGHSLSPTKVPFRANIWALKTAGCTHILATTACGSLRERMRPGDFVFIDQFIDFTKLRPLTFFEDTVVHTPMADPFDKNLRRVLINTAGRLHLRYHKQGTMVTVEGPRFSSRAESLMFKKMGGDLLNMSTVPEVTLANELGIPYQSVAMVTDYDCWKNKEESVSYDLVMQRMRDNSEKLKRLLMETIKTIYLCYSTCLE